MSISPTRSPFGNPSDSSNAAPASAPPRPADAKAAVGELLSELENTRKEYAKLSIQLSQVDAELHQSKELCAQHVETIGELERLLVSRDEEHRTAMREAEERYITKDTALAHRARHLELEVKRLQAENEHMAKIESDNRTLRENMLDLQASIEKLQVVNEDLRQRTRDGGGAAGAAYEDMEKEFQKRLAAAEKKFRAEAYRALSEEAKIALQGNDHLQNVLKRQNDSIELVLQRCKTLEQSHSLMQSQQERGAIEMDQQIREVNRLTRALEETRAKNQQLDEAMRQRRVERASLELLFVEYEATRKKLAKAEEKARRATREADRWKNRAVQLTQEMNDEQREVAERRLAQLQAMSDTVEMNALRDEYRSELRQKIQTKQQQGSLAFQFATGGGTSAMNVTTASMDNRYTFVDNNASFQNDSNNLIVSSTNPANAIKPMDILSIWNRKYDDGFTPNAFATESGKDAITTEEADRILSTIRAGVSPLTITNGGGAAPDPTDSLTTARPANANGNGNINSNSTAAANPLPPSTQQPQQHATPSASSSAIARHSLSGSGRRTQQNAQGASVVLPSVVVGGGSGGGGGAPRTESLVAEKNRQLSVLSQSHTLHTSQGTTARLPPSFQNQHARTVGSGGGSAHSRGNSPSRNNTTNAPSTGLLLSKDGTRSLLTKSSGASSMSVGGSSIAGTGGGPSARSGSALSSRGTLHKVLNDGEVKAISPHESLTKKGSRYAHPNPPRISPSTLSQIQQQNNSSSSNNADAQKEKIVP